MAINHHPYGQEDDADDASGIPREHADNMIAIVRASGNEQLAPEDKSLLWEKIAADIQERRVRNWWAYGWKAAAVVLVLLSAGLWWAQRTNTYHEPTLVAFAAQHQYEEGDTSVTRMVLGNNQQLQIRNNRASIAYQASGMRLKVDSQEVQQQLAAGEQVFNTLLVPYGNVASLQLEDGTQVWLNAGSRLVYPAAFGNKKREVFLEGEAYFDVQQDAERPFSVYAADMKIGVLGTTFNVSAYKDDAFSQVVLASGSVRLEAFRGPGVKQAAVQLTPGNRVLYAGNNGSMSVDQVDVNGYISWKDGIIVASHTPLNEILKKLSRYYNQPILIDARSGNETFSGNLNLQKTLNDVLDIVAATTSMRYEKQGNRVIFKTR